MKLRYRLAFLVIFLILLIIVGYFDTQNLQFITNDFWFASGFLLLILMSLIDQPFFSTDANVFMNGTAGLSLILIERSSRDFWWFGFLFWCLWLLITSFILMWFKANKPDSIKTFRGFIEKINREIGKPEALFSSFFLWGAIRQFGLGSKQIEPLFAFWAVFIILNMPSIARAIDKFFDRILNPVNQKLDIGSLFRVSDPRVLEIKLNKECPNKIVGQYFIFQTGKEELIGEGIVIDDRIIAGNRIAKIASTIITDRWNYIALNPEKISFSIKKDVENVSDVDIPISVVDIGSTMSSISFVVHPDFPLHKGEIVWTLNSDNVRVYFQITVATIVDQNSIEGSNVKCVLVTANQIGIWQEKEMKFKQYAWVPPAGFVIYLVRTDLNADKEIPDGKTQVGNIPNSGFPILADVGELVTHNTAIIGVTGSGKSYLAFHLIESYLEKRIKVFILDVTREYYLYLHKYNPTPLISVNDVKTWYEGESPLGIYQFATSTNYPDTTSQFVDEIFKILKKAVLKPGVTIPARLCVVFEEAHALIPEFTQVANKGDSDFVNATSRTILQGRKYGMGSLIVTQRTANVTKTILNQCNTIIALRSFDKTGLDFLSNYMGTEYAHAISTLPTYDAIIVGKASSCQTPVIFSIPDFSNRWNNEEET